MVLIEPPMFFTERRLTFHCDRFGTFPSSAWSGPCLHTKTIIVHRFTHMGLCFIWMRKWCNVCNSAISMVLPVSLACLATRRHISATYGIAHTAFRGDVAICSFFIALRKAILSSRLLIDSKPLLSKAGTFPIFTASSRSSFRPSHWASFALRNIFLHTPLLGTLHVFQFNCERAF